MGCGCGNKASKITENSSSNGAQRTQAAAPVKFKIENGKIVDDPNTTTNVTSDGTGKFRISNTTQSSRKKGKTNKVITANPHHSASIIWVSDWPLVVVAFNGELLDPSKFIYANEGGWIDMVKEPYDLHYNEDGLVNAIGVERKLGKVDIIMHSENECNECRSIMKKSEWWKPEVSVMSRSGKSPIPHVYQPHEMDNFSQLRDVTWRNRAERFR